MNVFEASSRNPSLLHKIMFGQQITPMKTINQIDTYARFTFALLGLHLVFLKGWRLQLLHSLCMGKSQNHSVNRIRLTRTLELRAALSVSLYTHLLNQCPYLSTSQSFSQTELFSLLSLCALILLFI